MSLYTEVQQTLSSTGQWITAPTPSRALDDIAAASPPGGSHDQPEAILFTAYHRTYSSNSRFDNQVWIHIKDVALLKALRVHFTRIASLYDSAPGIDARDIYVHRKKLGLSTSASLEARISITALTEFAEKQFAWARSLLESYPSGSVSWELLWLLVEVGQDLESVHDISGETSAFVLDSWSYKQESMGRAFILQGHFFQWAGTRFHEVPITKRIQEFSDLRLIDSLPTRPLTSAKKQLLQERGALYFSLARQAHVNHSGFFFTRASSGSLRLYGEGQVVIDVKSFRRFNPVLDHWADDANSSEHRAQYRPNTSGNSKSVLSFNVLQAYLCPPTLHGFSLRAKKWGEFLISQLTPIVWSDSSFEHLVIPDTYRRIIRSLVTVHSGHLKSKLMQDVIEGKGSGLVMAFHGSPGSGKTLTAEAVAEHLQKPLYVVSAGELGITVQNLERELKNVLDLATLWGAVLLIDEADIFLTKRDTNQLERNALVGVFLRMLEYFAGVLILTTNHLERFDEAFLSRCAVVLRFDALDNVSRRILWDRFLRKAVGDVTLFDIDYLSTIEINGRDIKHTIQTAQAIALCENERLSMAHFVEVIQVAKSGLIRPI